MTAVMQGCGWIAIAINLATAALGGWRWWRGGTAPWFWLMVRAGQVAAAVFAAACGVLALAGKRPDDSLFWLYVVLPIAVALVAEQLRVASAQAVLDARGLPDAQAVGRLPEAEQHAIVRQVLRREMGVMALAALIVALLVVRALTTSAGI